MTLAEDSVGGEGQLETGLDPAPHCEFRQVELEQEECLFVKQWSAERLPAPLPLLNLC